jgi:hypothetical protein
MDQDPQLLVRKQRFMLPSLRSDKTEMGQINPEPLLFFTNEELRIGVRQSKILD